MTMPRRVYLVGIHPRPWRFSDITRAAMLVTAPGNAMPPTPRRFHTASRTVSSVFGNSSRSRANLSVSIRNFLGSSVRMAWLSVVIVVMLISTTTLGQDHSRNADRFVGTWNAILGMRRPE